MRQGPVFGKVGISKENVDGLDTGCNSLLYAKGVKDVRVDVIVDKEVMGWGPSGRSAPGFRESRVAGVNRRRLQLPRLLSHCSLSR